MQSVSIPLTISDHDQRREGLGGTPFASAQGGSSIPQSSARARYSFRANERRATSPTFGRPSANLGSLAAFVDAVVLNDKLPIFDYMSTFPDRHEQDRADDARLVELCNRDEEVLVPVTVDYAAYRNVKQAALAELG